MKSIIILLLVCAFKEILSNGLIQVNYTKDLHREVFPIIINEKIKEFTSNLELTRQYNILYLSLRTNFDHLNATIIQRDVEKEVKNETIFGDEIKVSFYFKDDPQNKMTTALQFFASPSRFSNICQIALPYKVKDNSLSLIHHYYTKGLINHLSFSIVRNKDEGTIYFGGIPKAATENRTHSYCNVIGKSHYWDCFISHVKLDNATHIREYTINESNNYLIFDANTDFLFAPATFIDFLYGYYSSLDLVIYNFTSNSYRKRQLRASYSIHFKGYLHITIDNFAYTINLEPLWMCYDIYCYLEIIENPRGEMWTFTTGFYDKYNIIFDYEAKRINFYSMDGTVKAKGAKTLSYSNTNHAIMPLVMINVILLSLGLVYALIVFIKEIKA